MKTMSLVQNLQQQRFLVQILFVFLCIWIGIEFHYFVQGIEDGSLFSASERPPGVEAFLPISSLMSVYYFLLTGDIHSVHPAGFFIFIAIIVISVTFGKSFCSWMCPVGFISETIADFGDRVHKKFFKKTPKFPRFIDYPLRSIKYLLLGFFVYAIFFSMSAYSLKTFLDSPYNIMADIKMYYFFAEITQFSLIVIAVLFILSIFIRNFWCRYLCPYGALLGLTSLLSIFKIRRDRNSCTDCQLCTKACPNRIAIHKATTVRSDECSSCFRCVSACPMEKTLAVSTPFTKKALQPLLISLIIVVLYFTIVAFAKISGNWSNNLNAQQYIQLHQNVRDLGHPTSTKELRELDDQK